MLRISHSLSRTTICLSRTNRALLHHTASTRSNSSKHTTDSYSKDVDTTAVPDDSIHRVDSLNDSVQKPHEPPSGEWSRAGVESESYRHTEGKNEPYAPSGGNKGNYGSRMSWAEEKGPETSNPDEGPEGKNSGGRK